MTYSLNDMIDWSAPEPVRRENNDPDKWTLAAGEYPCKIVTTEMKASVDGTSTYLEMKFQVESGFSRDRLFFIRFYYQNEKYPGLASKGRKQLQELGMACFGQKPARGGDLVGGRCLVTISRHEGNAKPGGGKYSSSNRIESVRRLTETVISYNKQNDELSDQMPF